jgi:hypothetical protein
MEDTSLIYEMINPFYLPSNQECWLQYLICSRFSGEI